MMRFHDGMAVGHPPSKVGDAKTSQSVQDAGIPMDIDPPDNNVFVPSADTGLPLDDEDSPDNLGGESDDSGRYSPEPDSEEDLDIYE